MNAVMFLQSEFARLLVINRQLRANMREVVVSQPFFDKLCLEVDVVPGTRAFLNWLPGRIVPMADAHQDGEWRILNILWERPAEPEDVEDTVFD